MGGAKKYLTSDDWCLILKMYRFWSIFLGLHISSTSCKVPEIQRCGSIKVTGASVGSNITNMVSTKC
jgi:hypothetical protein